MKKTRFTKKEKETYDYVRSWMEKYHDTYGFGFWSKSLDTLGSYTGKSKDTVRRHLQKAVRLGLLYRVDVIGHPSLYLDKQPDIENVLNLCFNQYQIKEGYSGHMISMYGSDSGFYQEKYYYVEGGDSLWIPSEEIVPY